MIPTPQDVIAAFWQSDESDCTTIATIKAAIATYGVDSVFRAGSDGSGTWTVTFRDGSTLDIPDASIKSAQKYSGFAPSENLTDGQKSIYEYGLFCFGVFVANFARLKNCSFETALSTIDTEVDAYPDARNPCFRYLGIPATSVHVLNDPFGPGTKNVKDFAQENLYLLWNQYHAVFASSNVFDDYGDPADTSTFGDKHRKWVFFHWHGYSFWALKFIPD